MTAPPGPRPDDDDQADVDPGPIAARPEALTEDRRLSSADRLAYDHAALLSAAKSGRFTPRELASLMHLDPDHVRRYMVKLERCGHLELKRDPRNRRVVGCWPTFGPGEAPPAGPEPEPATEGGDS